MERRNLNLTSLAEVITEAEQLAEGQTRTTGSYSFGQILEHLARTMDIACGHSTVPQIALPMQIMARVFRPLVLYLPMRPGFKLPSNAQPLLWPTEEVAVDEALAHLREAMRRFEETEPLPKHPIFGKMNRAKSNQLQCRHCTLHLSFVHPLSAGDSDASGN